MTVLNRTTSPRLSAGSGSVATMSGTPHHPGAAVKLLSRGAMLGLRRRALGVSHGTELSSARGAAAGDSQRTWSAAYAANVRTVLVALWQYAPIRSTKPMPADPRAKSETPAQPARRRRTRPGAQSSQPTLSTRVGQGSDMVLTGIVPVVRAGQTASKFRMPSRRLPVSSWHCCAVVSSGCPVVWHEPWHGRCLRGQKVPSDLGLASGRYRT